MKKRILSFGVLGILAAALAGAPVSLPAQTNAKPAVAKPGASKTAKQATENKAGAKKARTLPFKGKLAAIDKMAKTIKVGERTFQITSTTRIFKAANPALLEDGVVGELVTGSYKTNEEGKLVANTVYYGGKTTGKAGAKGAEKKAGSSEKPAETPK